MNSSRARTSLVQLPTVRERVAHIASLMARGEWEPELVESLAAQWGVQPTAVYRNSAEASRRVVDVADADALRAEMSACLADARAEIPLISEPKARVEALHRHAALLAKLGGIGSTTRVVVSREAVEFGFEQPAQLPEGDDDL